MEKKQDPKMRRRPADDGLPESVFSYLVEHGYATGMSEELKTTAVRHLEEQINQARTADPGRVQELVNSLEFVKRLQSHKGSPWEERAGAFAQRIRRGEWDAIDRDAFMELLQQLSAAIRSRYDEPGAAAGAALRRIFDALTQTGQGRRLGFKGLKDDRSRHGREALLEQWLVYAQAKKEAAKLSKADEEFSTAQFLKKRLGADRLSAIEELIPSPDAKTKREMKQALGLNTRNKPLRRSSKPLR